MEARPSCRLAEKLLPLPDKLAGVCKSLSYFLGDPNPIALVYERENSARFKRLLGDVPAAALAAVELIVNRHLHEVVSAQLDEDLQTGKLVLRYMPDSLIGTLWYQLAESINSEKQFRTCHQCGEWFLVPSRGGRIPREFCSNACRSRAYRERQEKARQMHAEGKSAKEIAKELDTSVKTVKGWIKKGKSNG